MKKIKLIIIFLVVILIICIAFAILSKNKNIKNKEIENDNAPLVILTKTLNDVNGKEDYFTIKKCVKEFIDLAIDNNSNGIKAIAKTVNSQNINDIIEEFSFENSKDIYIEEMKVMEGYTYSQYFVKGKENINSNDHFYLNINLDYSNYTYEINVLNKIDYDKNIKNVNVIEEKKIAKNAYNDFKEEFITDEYMTIEYFDDYKYKMLNNVEIAYSFLDENYRKKRFETIEKFEEYIEENKSNIINSTVVSYSSTGYGDYREYIFVDNYNNYYTLKENAIMDYKIILDDYTIFSDEFVENYKRASNIQKVATDVDIFIKMINSKDYDSAYKLLDDGFKNNYFNSMQEFKNYAEENFYNYNYIVDKGISEKGSIYQYEATISSGTSSSSYKTKKTFLIRLGSGTDFDISFNMD